jgi:hypothetical protein
LDDDNDSNTRHIQYIPTYILLQAKGLSSGMHRQLLRMYYCTLPRPHYSVPDLSRTYSSEVFAVTSILGMLVVCTLFFLSFTLSRILTIIPLTSTPFLAYHPPTSLPTTATGVSSASTNRHSSALSLPDTPAANRCSPTSFSLLDNTHTLPQHLTYTSFPFPGAFSPPFRLATI